MKNEEHIVLNELEKIFSSIYDCKLEFISHDIILYVKDKYYNFGCNITITKDNIDLSFNVDRLPYDISDLNIINYLISDPNCFEKIENKIRSERLYFIHTEVYRFLTNAHENLESSDFPTLSLNVIESELSFYLKTNLYEFIDTIFLYLCRSKFYLNIITLNKQLIDAINIIFKEYTSPEKNSYL